MLYDPFGRLVTIMTLDISSQGDTRYVRRDVNDSLTKNYDWLTVVGNNFRIKDGKAQFKNEDTGLWHTLRIKNVDGNATIYPDDNPVA